MLTVIFVVIIAYLVIQMAGPLTLLLGMGLYKLLGGK